MKNKGFTLVELLAVVVVLAVVSIIAIPITINIIENARKGALESSARGLMEAANNYYTIHGKDMTDYVDFSIVNGKQTSSEKLSYKGSIDNGYLRLVDANTMALCIDDNKYYVVKNLDSKELVLDEGVCSGEYDEDLLGFVPEGNGNYIGTRLNVKAYSSSSDLPSSTKAGSVAVITDKKITDYFVANTGPTVPKDGMVWLVQSYDTSQYIETKNSRIGIAYVVQYDNNEWKLKESYIYNDGWNQLTSYGGSVYEWNYEYTGHYETFNAPFSGYYTIELWGASGGDYNVNYVGGNGAYTKGDIYLTAGETLYVYVGSQGSRPAGGWNGGGSSNTSSYAGGGGATDVRTVATSSNTSWSDIESLRTRIMVAGAGGGAGYYNSGNYGSGGAAGGLNGYTAPKGGGGTDGTGGTQINAGTCSTCATGSVGSFGMGGPGNCWGSGNGGGGAGWYGGGGGYAEGGGGGSSYISGHRGAIAVDESLHTFGSHNSYTGKYFVNTLMIDGEGYSWSNKKGNYTGMPNYNDGTTMKANDGNGYARIKFKKFASMTDNEYTELGANIQNEWLYNYMGYYQVFKAPKAGTYKFELWGAQGGTRSYAGGLGAYTKGELTLTKGETLYIYVGGQGGTGAGGWNGGGSSNTSSYGGGGGATDIRITPTNALTGWNGIESLKSRIMVAGAGGGGGYYNSGNYGYGGAAGGLIAYTAPKGGGGTDGTGGTQTSAGTCSTCAAGSVGSFGIGGPGNCWGSGNGGGGAGWYGGGGGYAEGGGGGSSYISGHNGSIGMNIDTTMKTDNSESYTGYKFNNPVMIDGQGYEWGTSKGSQTRMPTHDAETLVNGNEGNGFAKVTYIGS